MKRERKLKRDSVHNHLTEDELAHYGASECATIPEAHRRLVNALTVARKELEREEFMADIETMVYDLIRTYHEVSNEQKKMFE